MASERYLLDEMADTERDSFEEHFFSCHECADDMRVAGVMVDGVRAGLLRHAPATGPTQARKVLEMPQARRAWRPSIVLPWAVAATLALVTGYQSLSVQPGALREGALVLAPATLRPATRGQEAVVRPGPGGMITLALDLGEISGGGAIRYEIRRDTGEAVVSGEAQAPPAGGPLLLLVPSSLLKASERYSLGVQGAENAGLTREEYRFRVEDPQKR
jgi:hypothetical protein